MKSCLKDYISEWEDQLNIDLMEKTADTDLITCIVDTWRSLEVVPQIRFIGYEYDPSPSDTEINDYIYKREKKKKKKEKFDIKLKNDNLVGKLTVKLEATILEEDPKTKEKNIKVYPIKKTMLVPLQDDDGYYYLKGKRFYLIYQMTESSTYNASQSVTLKSLMPIAVKRKAISVYDLDNNEYILPYYSVFVLRKEISTLLFYLSRGLYWALDFLNVLDVIDFIEGVPEPDERDDMYLYFSLSSRCTLRVIKELFDKYQYIQSVVGSFCEISSNRTTIQLLNDKKQWIRRLVNPNNYDKGLGILRFFNRLLDKNTKRDLRLPEYHKRDIYCIIRWMMQHFQELRKKDNCSLKTKRLRCAECISALMDQEFSNRLYRIISHGNRLTIDNIKELFKFSGEILIQKMHSSGLLRYDDVVNDMTMWSKLRYTSKGIHSLGGKNGKNISIRYRAIHPSHLGYLDILVCSTSDPGLSGVLSPFAKIKGLYFDDKNEPSDFYYELLKDLKKIYERTGKIMIGFNFEDPEAFYRTLYELDEYTDNHVKIYGTSKEGEMDIIIEEEIDIDENTKQIGNHLKEEEAEKKQKEKEATKK